MKKIIITLGLLVMSTSIFAQCIPTKNDFQLKLQHTAPGELTVYIQHTNEGNSNFNQRFSIDGLVFAVQAPSSNSNVKITNCKTTHAPFALTIAGNNTTQNKTQNTVTTFAHDAALPAQVGASFTNNTWHALAVIQYTGQLKNNELFYLLNCDYGIIHPNSYYGNSTTDPWLSIITDDNEYVQYTPSIVVPDEDEMIAQIKTFPNPVQHILNIQIPSATNNEAMIKIVSIGGQVVHTSQVSLQKGLNTFSVPTQSLVTGNYIIQILDGKSIKYASAFTKE
jgi:Secretion system C-terminal sorting domain